MKYLFRLKTCHRAMGCMVLGLAMPIFVTAQTVPLEVHLATIKAAAPIEFEMPPSPWATAPKSVKNDNLSNGNQDPESVSSPVSGIALSQDAVSSASGEVTSVRKPSQIQGTGAN